MANQLLAGVGTHGFWGLFSTLNLLEAIGIDSQTLENNSIDNLIRLLLVNPGDVRHIVTTISCCKRK